MDLNKATGAIARGLFDAGWRTSIMSCHDKDNPMEIFREVDGEGEVDHCSNLGVYRALDEMSEHARDEENGTLER